MSGGVHRLFNNSALRRLLVRLRIPLFVAAGTLIAWHARPEWYFAGLGVSAFGEAIQLWCFASLQKNQVLAANGPYALVRNPMYLGRYFLLAGMLLLLGNGWLIAVFTVLYYLYMVNRVRREEALLAPTFGEGYARYCAAVPRFVPRLARYAQGRIASFDWSTFVRNHGPRNLLEAVAFYALAYYFAFLAG
ncbi:MAG: isoprenylcysteine carboxylmethyltransferase family protein [Burkholderiales bacterium]|nr:isoprenylcysteine carboxylmethyltransferase family protein [Burkholderiales bacterium]